MRTREERKKIRKQELWGEPSILSANKVDDPLFATGTKWTFGAGWTNTTPTATCDGTATATLTYDATGLVTAGKTYRLTIVQAGTYTGTKPGIQCAFGGATGLNLSPSADGIATATGVWEATDNNLDLVCVNTDDFVGTITTVVLKEFI